MAEAFQLFFIVIALIIVSIIATACFALALPACFVWALASAAWTGEIRLAWLRQRAAARQDPDAPGEGGAEASADPRPGWLDQVRIGRRSHPDSEVARRSYYFGPSVADGVAALRSAWLARQALIASGQGMADLADGSDVAAWGIVLTVSLNIGTPLGSVGGAALVGVLSVVYFAVSVVTLAVAVVAGLACWTLDMAVRFVGGVKLTCLSCGSKVHPYPHYRCPGCRLLHRDIRPGEYGVLTRVCVCGRRFSTMLITGAHKLEKVCPSCEASLPDRFGRAPEVPVPVFGASNAGKTQLVLMLATLLKDRVHERGGRVRSFADANERLDVIADSLRASGRTEKTAATQPQGLTLEIEYRAHEWLVCFFDAAGELFLREDGLGEMRYLNKARTYIHVADPLSSPALWSRLSPADQERLEPFRSGDGAVAEVYQRTANQMLKMPPPRQPARLAFVVSKLDLLRSAGCDIGSTSAEIQQWVSDEAGLDMEDITRGADQRFSGVRYFGTAAVQDDDGQVDASVAELLRWILSNEGITNL